MKVSKYASYNIQVYRGFAILAVVLIHNLPDGQGQIWIRPFLNFAVSAFIFLSGYLSRRESWNPIKRITKILIPYFIWSLIYVIINHYKAPTDIPQIYLKQLICGNASAVMYYTFVYVELTFLIPLIDKLARSKYKYAGFLISPVEIIGMRLLPLVFNLTINHYLEMIIRLSCLGWFTYFYLGYLLGNKLIQIKASSKQLVFFLIVAVLLQLGEGYLYYILGSNNAGTQLKLSAILTSTIINLLFFKSINSEYHFEKLKLFHQLGNYSFGIFYAHLAIMRVLHIIPYYKGMDFFPVNGVIAIMITCMLVGTGRKMIGKYSKYIAF